MSTAAGRDHSQDRLKELARDSGGKSKTTHLEGGMGMGLASSGQSGRFSVGALDEANVADTVADTELAMRKLVVPCLRPIHTRAEIATS